MMPDNVRLQQEAAEEGGGGGGGGEGSTRVLRGELLMGQL